MSTGVSTTEGPRRGEDGEGADDGTLASLSAPGRALYLTLGVALPLACFAMAFEASPIAPEWQVDHFITYARLLLGGPPTWVMYPLLGYAMGSLALAVLQPTRHGTHPLVRLGVYSGVPLAAQYAAILTLSEAWASPGVVVALVLGLLLTLGLSWAAHVWRASIARARRWIWRGAGALLLLAVVVGLVVGLSGNPAALWVPLLGTLAVAPYWTLLAFARLSLRVAKTPGGQRWPGRPVPVAGWVAAWGSAWVAAVKLAMDAYDRLPETPPPGCYVCTAARQGHPWLVGRGDGAQSRAPNPQARHLKLFELALAGVAPRAHHALRSIYDVLGPRLARRIRHPLVADVAYLLLKPFEWLALAAVRAGRGEPLALGGGPRGGGLQLRPEPRPSPGLEREPQHVALAERRGERGAGPDQ